MRQREDVGFAQALNNMAIGRMTVENIQLIHSRTFSTLPPAAIATRPFFFYFTNTEVNAKNTEVLNAIMTKSAMCTAIDIATGDGGEHADDALIQQIRNRPRKQNMNLLTDLYLRVGA